MQTTKLSWLEPENWKTPRWRTAIARRSLSTPLQAAMKKGLLDPAQSHLDFGCGRGDDVRNLQAKGHKIAGFDPYYCRETTIAPADVVSLVFVLNVIESEIERQLTLAYCWKLTRKTLIVGVRTDSKGEVITAIGTYQRYYTNAELKAFVQAVLPSARVETTGSGICFVSR